MRWFKVRRRRRATTVTKHYLAHKEIARQEILSRLEHWNSHYEFAFNRVAIRNQQRCWGSCSSNQNLNFSYKLVFLPRCLMDYVVVHELCHLREMNHGPKFWALVEETLPDYKELRRQLRQLERSVGSAVSSLEKEKAAHAGVACAYCMK